MKPKLDIITVFVGSGSTNRFFMGIGESRQIRIRKLWGKLRGLLFRKRSAASQEVIALPKKTHIMLEDLLVEGDLLEVIEVIRKFF